MCELARVPFVWQTISHTQHLLWLDSPRCNVQCLWQDLNTTCKLCYAKSCSSSSLRTFNPQQKIWLVNMAGKFTVGTPNTLEKVWNIDVEREYRKLSCLFQNPERNNGIITESLRQLKMFIHQQSTTIMFHCFFGENLSEFEIAWEVISLFLELLQNVMKHSPRSCGYK